MKSNNTYSARKFETLKSESGVSLIITFFIMIIVLTIVLSISIILYSEVKVIRNIGNSVDSFYAADSGIEKILYYDRQVIPTGGTRGLCSMYPYNAAGTPSGCPGSDDVAGLATSVYCNPEPGFHFPVPGDNDPIHGCEPKVCDDCTISFNTILENGTYYTTTATVSPSVGSSSNLEVDSKGTFEETQRQIQIVVYPFGQ